MVLERAIQSLRLRLHSGLRQQGRRLRRDRFMARLKPCPSDAFARSCADGDWLCVVGALLFGGWFNCSGLGGCTMPRVFGLKCLV
jgi:hypothetical protein